MDNWNRSACHHGYRLPPNPLSSCCHTRLCLPTMKLTVRLPQEGLDNEGLTPRPSRTNLRLVEFREESAQNHLVLVISGILLVFWPLIMPIRQSYLVAISSPIGNYERHIDLSVLQAR